MIRRAIHNKAIELATQYPVVTITGPRQSGKTTLAMACFPKYAYYSLEDPDVREYARTDPRGFLSSAERLIIDEIQKVPNLVSYIQGIVDKTQIAGQFILTGSHQFELTSIISQSLAGRTSLIKLLPFSMYELNENKTPAELIYRGFYPRIIDCQLNPTEALAFYTNTYLERDLRELREIRNLTTFERFLKLCAANTGQILNKNRFANDIGMDNKTIDSWLSVLEASFIIKLLPPHYQNFRKRLVKSPKLYFFDVGLAAYLLGMKNPSHVDSHPLKGALFENLVIMEKFKQKYNSAATPNLYYFRDNTGNEVDLLEEDGPRIYTYEIKLSGTLGAAMFKGLDFYGKLNPNNSKSILVYGGKERTQRYGHECVPFNHFPL
ncbi:MAG: ATP-binding protein [Deltaproteobacteria bacterium]|nr:ATP-binding protein [Deltaproteobacteria bacterium]